MSQKSKKARGVFAPGLLRAPYVSLAGSQVTGVELQMLSAVRTATAAAQQQRQQQQQVARTPGTMTAPLEMVAIRIATKVDFMTGEAPACIGDVNFISTCGPGLQPRLLGIHEERGKGVSRGFRASLVAVNEDAR